MSLVSTKAWAGQRLRAVRSRARGCAIALTYHRVADLATDPQLQAVSVAHFEEQVRAIASQHTTLTAGELFAAMREGRRLPDRAVVITLDDGYEDALLAAKPILDRYEVRATVFVTSGQVGSGREFWWDEVERIVLMPGELPARIEIEARGAMFESELRDDAIWGEGDAAREAGWNIGMPVRNQRQHLYLALCDFLRPLAGATREIALGQLREHVGAGDFARSTHRALSPAQLLELTSGGTFEIGAHTTSHALLSALGPDAQREEIEESRRALADLAGTPVTSFCYPHGGRDAYTPLTERLVRAAGFDGACANHYGIVLPWRDRYAVPRCPTEDVGGEAFATRLAGWFDAGR